MMAALPGERSKPAGPLAEFVVFGWKQARSCVFAGSFFVVLLVSSHLPLGALARYDFILLAAIAIQIVLLARRLETPAEAAVLIAFHLLGLGLEWFKTRPEIGSWSYPEPAFSKLGAVPLYSGFMYAAVASYMCQSWRILRLRLTGYPPHALSLLLSAAIYANFFTHHYIPDYRWHIAALAMGLYARAVVVYRPLDKDRRMPLLLSFVLTGFFVWLAENISTFFSVWQYPHQVGAWAAVHVGKWTSWSLLVIMTFTIVAQLKHIKKTIYVPD